jgi:hypothetical protein
VTKKPQGITAFGPAKWYGASAKNNSASSIPENVRRRALQWHTYQFEFRDSQTPPKHCCQSAVNFVQFCIKDTAYCTLGIKKTYRGRKDNHEFENLIR